MHNSGKHFCHNFENQLKYHFDNQLKYYALMSWFCALWESSARYTVIFQTDCAAVVGYQPRCICNIDYIGIVILLQIIQADCTAVFNRRIQTCEMWRGTITLILSAVPSNKCPHQERNRGLHGPEKIWKREKVPNPATSYNHNAKVSVPSRDANERPYDWKVGPLYISISLPSVFHSIWYLSLFTTPIKLYKTSCESRICQSQSPLQFVCELEFGLRSDWAAVH